MSDDEMYRERLRGRRNSETVAFAEPAAVFAGTDEGLDHIGFRHGADELVSLLSRTLKLLTSVSGP
jgi:hypothetical protein